MVAGVQNFFLFALKTRIFANFMAEKILRNRFDTQNVDIFITGLYFSDTVPSALQWL